MKRNLAKPCALRKEGWIIPYLAGAEQMSDTMVDLSPGISEQKKRTVSKFKVLLFQLEELEAEMIEIVTGPNLDKMGDVTADGNMCAYAKQNSLLYKTACSTSTEPLSRA